MHPYRDWIIGILCWFLALAGFVAIVYLSAKAEPLAPAWIETEGSRILRAEVAFPVYAEIRGLLLAECLKRGGIFGESLNEEKQRVYYHCTLSDAQNEPELKAEASFPTVIFHGEKPLAEWKGNHPENQALSWEMVEWLRCREHGGYMVATPDKSSPEQTVHYTCLRAVNAVPGEKQHGA